MDPLSVDSIAHMRKVHRYLWPLTRPTMILNFLFVAIDIIHRVNGASESTVETSKYNLTNESLRKISGFSIRAHTTTSTSTADKINTSDTGDMMMNEIQHLSAQETSSEPLDVLMKLNDNQSETNALIYLQKYGYMNPRSNVETNNLISEESFSGAVSSFQRFAGIPETGTIDNQTLRFMRMPRCGNVDKVSELTKLNSYLNKLWTNSSSVVRKRRKRYALQGSKWRRQELTYRISQYPTRFNGKRHEVDAQIEKAFGIWSQVAPINFVVKKEGRVHIDIRFASGDHGDGDAFDGPGNTLAHAYFPQYGGDAHFDDQEYWTIDSYTGTNIFQVAAHELGHSLGLGHSNVREALMAPFYQKYKPNFKLHVDDILAIQALYGEKPFLPDVPSTSLNDIGGLPFESSSSNHHYNPVSSSIPTTITTTTTSTTTTTTASPALGSRYPFGLSPDTRFPFRPTGNRPSFTFGNRDSNDDENENGIDGNPMTSTAPPSNGNDNTFPGSLPVDLCSDPVIDAITRTDDGKSYVFKGEYYWLLTNDGLSKDYPRKISQDWDGLPGSLDAALTWADGKTFFFKGNKYWRFRNRRRDVGYPKLINAGFSGIPDNIDAAFVWSGNGRTYIFKGTEYWRFDSKADPPVSSEYPRSIKVWNGVPYHISAAFRWENNVTYFFKGNQYYRFNDKDFKVESRGKPPFPRPSAEWWFGCANTNLAQKALPGLFRETSSEEVVPQDIDWSYLAGLEENTKIMGTHISDHKPPQVATNSTNVNISNSDTARLLPKASVNTPINKLFGSRIGLFNHNKVHSSATPIGYRDKSWLKLILITVISILQSMILHRSYNK